MSKIGRKAIPFSSAKIEIQGNTVLVNGPKAKFTHELPHVIGVSVEDGALQLSVKKDTRENRMLWGMHRALLANKVKGAETGFEKKIKIVGLGYKAQLAGKKLTFSLGYSHKIDYELPEGVDVKLDKTGQNLVFSSSNKLLLGDVCSHIRKLRPPEPYKGTGIIVGDEVIIRKAGKTKAAA
jgi:large subunit ribosomal protein L6